MSVLSRKLPRRGAAMVSVFALAVFIVGIMATPAFAQTGCTAGPAAGQVNLNVGTDDVLVLAEVGGEIFVSENGAALVSCPVTPITTATTDWLQIVGSNAGNETVSIHSPEDSGVFAGFTTTFNGGNGNDTLIFEYGAIPGLGLAEDPFGAFINMRQAGTAIAVDVTALATDAEMRIDNAEVVRVNGSSSPDGLCASATVHFPGCGGGLTAQTSDIPLVTGDDIVIPATAPVTQGLTLFGAAGNDVLASGDGADNFQGAGGSDAVSYEASAAAVTVDLAAATGTGMGADTLADVQDVAGSLNGDTLLGNSLDNNIFGDDGDDIIDGREGNDGGTPGSIPGVLGLLGGDDDDSLTGGTGTDIVGGDAGADVVNEDAAANGADVLDGDAGCDELNYGLRTTAITVAPPPALSGAALEGDLQTTFESYVTGSGADTLIGTPSYETFQPGAGDDVVDGNGPTLFGAGANPCLLFSGDQLDLSVVPGPAVFNLITGMATGNGTDTFSDMEQYVGTAGDDTLIVGDTAANGNTLGDFISDGGIDWIDGTLATINLFIDLTFFGNDCSPVVGCLEVENVTGGAGNDTILGNGLNNNLVGGAGVDFILGGSGNDAIEGGAGNDILSGDAGGDTLQYKNSPSGVEVDNQLGFATGGDGEDSIAFFEIVVGSNFDDIIIGGQTAFSANNRYVGRAGNDILTGTNSSDTIKGGAGDDEIRSASGDDVNKGGSGNDLILAGNGNDVLSGGNGQDTGNGQQGFDSCHSIENPIACEA